MLTGILRLLLTRTRLSRELEGSSEAVGLVSAAGFEDPPSDAGALLGVASPPGCRVAPTLLPAKALRTNLLSIEGRRIHVY